MGWLRHAGQGGEVRGHAQECSEVDSRYSWLRLAVSMLIATIGSVGMWSVVVVLPAVQAEFGVARADASLPYTLTMVGFAFGNVFIGRILDRTGILVPLI